MPAQRPRICELATVGMRAGLNRASAVPAQRHGICETGPVTCRLCPSGSGHNASAEASNLRVLPKWDMPLDLR